MMDRDEARRRVREFLPAEDTTPAVFQHPSLEQPLLGGDLAAIITRLRADLGVNFPEPMPTPTDFVRLEGLTPADARAITDFLQVHFEGFERRQGMTLLQPVDGRETSVTEIEYHLTLVERYAAAQRFFASVAASDVSAILV